MTAVPFRLSMRELVTGAFGPLRPDHGIDDGETDEAEARLGLRLPAILREHYALAGRHRQVMDGMNHVLGPADLYLKNGALVFEKENQFVALSALLLDDLANEPNDPPVVHAGVDEDRWRRISTNLSDYLLALTCWQACNALPAVAQAAFSPEQLTRMKAELHWAAFGADGADQTIGLWGGVVAATSFTKSREVFVAAGADELLDGFADRFGLQLSFL
jgi:hypothetical protein